MVRLNKYLSDAGVCSRREADRLIESGQVSVDGQRAVPGMKVADGQEVKVGKKVIRSNTEKIVLAVNKPAGIVCTEDVREKKNIIRYLKYPVRVTYAGRLDKDSEGLLISKMKEGVRIVDKEKQLDVVTRPCKAEKLGKYTFSITLTQGLNRQIRRMCEALGYKVERLVRVRIMNIELGSLKPGAYRKLTEQELKELYEQVKESQNAGISRTS